MKTELLYTHTHTRRKRVDDFSKDDSNNNNNKRYMCIYLYYVIPKYFDF